MAGPGRTQTAEATARQNAQQEALAYLLPAYDRPLPARAPLGRDGLDGLLARIVGQRGIIVHGPFAGMLAGRAARGVFLLPARYTDLAKSGGYVAGTFPEGVVVVADPGGATASIFHLGPDLRDLDPDATGLWVRAVAFRDTCCGPGDEMVVLYAGDFSGGDVTGRRDARGWVFALQTGALRIQPAVSRRPRGVLTMREADARLATQRH